LRAKLKIRIPTEKLYLSTVSPFSSTFVPMLSLMAICFNTLAHGRAWNVREASTMASDAVQRVKLSMDVDAENRRIGRPSASQATNCQIDWTLDVVSAEATAFQTGEICLIRSYAEHCMALAWFVKRNSGRWCELMIVSPKSARPEVAFRHLGEIWVVQGMPPMVIDQECVVSTPVDGGVPMRCEDMPRVECGSFLGLGDTRALKPTLESTPARGCFQMLARFFRRGTNAVAPGDV
jgi:hypothetical protein